MDNQPTQPPINFPEYVTLPADDYREMYEGSRVHVPTTAGDRVGRTAERTVAVALFGGLLFVGVQTVTKALDYIEDRRLQRELRKAEAEKPAPKA